jgi:tRNA pseudouridine55 synthase
MADDILLINKPVGFSSFQMVRILKKYYKKVGHAGTLDPFASGLLIILTGQATKKFREFETFEKEYVGEMYLGMITDTYDIGGKLIDKLSNNSVTQGFSLANAQNSVGQSFANIPVSVVAQSFSFANIQNRIKETARCFIGKIEQIPPRFSALKIHGRKLYELSRKGADVKPKSRRVFIKSFEITEINCALLKFSAVVGKGVYIRSLIYDFGLKLGCGATLLSLRRTRIGGYQLSQAKKLGEILHTLNSPPVKGDSQQIPPSLKGDTHQITPPLKGGDKGEGE